MYNKEILKVVTVLILVLTTTKILGQNPFTDPSNTDGWVLNTTISDEFNGGELDKTKWWILGENGDYRSKWKGRAPGQFVPHNVKVEGGDLVLTSQWEPSYTFANAKQDGTYYGGTSTNADNSKPITQACVMSETFFKYGYMEIRARIADAPVTSAFWTTGYHSEIDMVENYGKRPIGNPQGTNASIERKQRTNLINWDPDIPANHENWKVDNDMGIRLAEDYHVYGFEWDKDYIKTYLDGVLLRHVTRQELEANDQWRHDAPQELWFDSEVFSWYGLPSQADLSSPAEYKIDYVRIWQKEINGPSFNALGFEGPFYFQGRSQAWWNSPTAEWRIKNEKPASGDFSIRFQHSGTFSGNYTTFTPYGSLSLPAGSNRVSFKIWIDPSTSISELRMVLENPSAAINIDVSGVQKGQWVEVSKTFSRSVASNPSIENGDRIRLMLQSDKVTGSQALFYIDDILFDNTLSTAKVNAVDFSIYPNPTKNTINIKSPLNGVVQVFDMAGALVKTFEKQTLTTSVEDLKLAPGVYLFRIQSAHTSASTKVVIK
ncbi:T9SS type A sorting domain-containing protein [Tamlana agarivorans]|uniref:T9SS type A sorting domain-containing protein n=1 Tax=Pseudotamlana agarivorans TaxID=481183 RepID=A0ACC5U9I7_9FLAO|nr:T9SS type A sorting domain-containing protein [Tamlana agarivorans]MBU2950997.1 T9SS type A sorting domain-containing protein [Tamlana agarivorans]